MIRRQEIDAMKEYFIEYWKAYGRLTNEQERYLRNLRFNVSPFPANNNSAGYYDQENDLMAINSNYANDSVLRETIFHELDHARCSYINAQGRRETGFFDVAESVSIDNATRQLLGIEKGSFFGEGITAINGENVYHSWIGDKNWREISNQHPDQSQFSRHSFPSGLWWYKLNGNFISQISAVMGISENEFCAMADNGKGRETIIRKFDALTNSTFPLKFEHIEKGLDFVATLSKMILTEGNPSPLDVENADKKIESAQEALFQTLRTSYEENKISKKEFIERFDKFNRYTTTRKLKENFMSQAIKSIDSKQNVRAY